VTIVAALLTLICVGSALLAPWVAPHNPFDSATLNLTDGFTPPAWTEKGSPTYFLGTDDQGRDVFSTILYGTRISLGVGLAAVAFRRAARSNARASVGLHRRTARRLHHADRRRAAVVSGDPHCAADRRARPRGDAAGNARQPGDPGADPRDRCRRLGPVRSHVRGSVLVEKNKEYVQAARVIGRHPLAIMVRHVLPNVIGPVLVIGTIHIATAIITEATLSFLGVGVPPTQPSLGTLIRVGNDFMMSGEWWISVFPGIALIVLVLSVNLVGDWLRDALNPKLR
jgi:peptide/nickel transport system permease protein